MRLQSAIFDMDGTLLDSMPMWHELPAIILRQYGVEPEEAVLEQMWGKLLPQQAVLCKELCGLSQSLEQITADMLAVMEAYYRTDVQVKPGVPKFLSLLKMEGVWMYVATGTDRRLTEIALRRAGLEGYFRGVLTCPEVGLGKDSPEIYERALRRLRSTKKDTVVFEDSLMAARTAKNAGFRVAGVADVCAAADQEALRALADYYIPSYEEMFETQTMD